MELIFKVLCCVQIILIFTKTAELLKQKSSVHLLENVSDIKEFKKVLRTRNNVLALFYNSEQDAKSILKTMEEVAGVIKGSGTIIHLNCGSEAKKTCKKLKILPEGVAVKHYKDGEFHKDYDRKLALSSIINFMRDPSGDLPWEEDNLATDVAHVMNAASLTKLIRMETKPMMVMFYAPWCGFCKRLKPEYSQVATALKGEALMAAMDVNRPENSIVREHFNITGFPTLIYFEGGKQKFIYEGEYKKDSLIQFMKNPSPPKKEPQEEKWSDTPSDVVHLNSTNFDDMIKGQLSIMVMFYAPWCGHCKNMKPEYVAAAADLKISEVTGKLAAVDATTSPDIAAKFGVKSYPTVKYFENGVHMYDLNLRQKKEIVDFMKNPKEPPPPPKPEAPWEEVESHVSHLNEENYKTSLKKKKHALVIFYAPWCGHCKKAKPEFQAAADHFQDDPKVILAAVDCTKHSGLCKENDISGYPTFKYFSYYNKATYSYSGGRTSKDFITFLKDPKNREEDSSQSSPKEEWKDLGSEYLHHLTSLNFDSTLKEHSLVLVVFYAPWCGHCKAMKKDFSESAMLLGKDKFPGALATVDATHETSLAQRFSIQGFPTIKLFHKGKFVQDYVKSRTVPDFVRFMQEFDAKIQKDEL